MQQNKFKQYYTWADHIICRQLFAGHAEGSQSVKKKKKGCIEWLSLMFTLIGRSTFLNIQELHARRYVYTVLCYHIVNSLKIIITLYMYKCYSAFHKHLTNGFRSLRQTWQFHYVLVNQIVNFTPNFVRKLTSSL